MRLREILIAASLIFASPSTSPSLLTTLHFAPNGNFDVDGRFMPGESGFNLSDVHDIRDLDRLPDNVAGLVWVGQCNGVDAKFIKLVQPFLHHPKLFGFYLMDDPDPTWRHGRYCAPEHLMAEADWIRSQTPAAKTFVMLMNLGPSRAPSFRNSYNPENTHIDLFGVGPYPCRAELGKCDLAMIDRFVAAAVAAGIPVDGIVPGFQTFGGGTWVDDEGERYAVPSADNAAEIIARWATLVPRPAFDYSYSWGVQRNDVALENSPELRAVLAAHNNARREQ